MTIRKQNLDTLTDTQRQAQQRARQVEQSGSAANVGRDSRDRQSPTTPEAPPPINVRPPAGGR